MDNALTRFYGQIKSLFVSKSAYLIDPLKCKIFPFNKSCAVLALSYFFFQENPQLHLPKGRKRTLVGLLGVSHDSLQLSILMEMAEPQVEPGRPKGISHSASTV